MPILLDDPTNTDLTLVDRGTVHLATCQVRTAREPISRTFCGRGIGELSRGSVFSLDISGAPYVEVLRGKTVLSAALAIITAAVVGVVLNLAAWFALHVLFADLTELRWLRMKIDIPCWPRPGFLRWS